MRAKSALPILLLVGFAPGCTETPVPKVVKAVPIVKPQPPMTAHFAVPVLMYHRIADLTPKEARSPLIRDLTVSPADFEAQVRYLSEQKFTFLLARDVAEAIRLGKPLPERAIAITMDDGYDDNFDNAFPILKKYSACATIYLVSSTVGTPKHLSWDQTLEMQRDKVRYGSHTVRHYDLTTLDQPTLDFELVESKRVLEEKIGEVIPDLAYPTGAYNAEVVGRTREAGYLAAWKKGGGPVEPTHDPYLLPRVRVHGRTLMKDFERKVWSGREVQALRRQQHLLARK